MPTGQAILTNLGVQDICWPNERWQVDVTPFDGNTITVYWVGEPRDRDVQDMFSDLVLVIIRPGDSKHAVHF